MSAYLTAPGVEPVRIRTYGRRRPGLINQTSLPPVSLPLNAWRAGGVSTGEPSYVDFLVPESDKRIGVSA